MPRVQRGKVAAISTRWTRRVAAPCVCFVPWAALASCRPLPQQLLPVSATGGGRRRCTFFSLLRFRVAAGPSLRPRLVKMCLERPCGCAAMKAPVGLSSRRAVCDSRWKDFVLTSVGAAPNTNIKINFPLNMTRAQAEAILNRLLKGQPNAKHRPDLCGQAQREVLR